MKKSIIKVLLFVGIAVTIFYFQFGRDVTVNSSSSFLSGDLHEQQLTITANKILIIDKKQFSTKLIQRCLANDFQEVLFSYDVTGEPARIRIIVFPNELLKKLDRGSFTIVYDHASKKSDIF